MPLTHALEVNAAIGNNDKTAEVIKQEQELP